MKRIFPITIGIIILGLFAYTVFFLYQKSKPRPEVFKTEVPIITDIIKKTVATGSVKPRRELKIKPIVSGVIEKIYVEAGRYVNAGEIIAKIRINPNLVSLNNAENNLNRSKLTFEKAKIDFDRNEKLFNEKVISFVDFNNFKVSFETAKEDLRAAENQLNIVREGASLKSNRRSNLVKATAYGMILDIPVKEGGFVIESNNFNEGTTIAILADMNDMIFEGKIEESEVGKIKKGMDIELTIGAIEDKKYKAILEFISPRGATNDAEGANASANSGEAIQFIIRAALKINTLEFLRSGYSATADIILDKRQKVLAISEGLLQFGKDSVYVEVETAPQIFEKRLVKTGLSDGILTEIISGISKADKIKNPIKEVVPIPVGSDAVKSKGK